MTRPPEFEGFSDLDRTGRTDVYAGYLDLVRGLEAVAEWKERSFAALAPHPGAVLLDVGCGTGEDVRALARLVAPGGRAIGVDASEAMVTEARRRAAEAREQAVEFRRSDARTIALPDGVVDGCRTERVLQHVEEPAAVVKEMVRVVRPGGTVVAAEPDWGTLVIDSGDPAIAARVADAAGRRVRSGLVGRSLRRLFLDAGLEDVTAVARTLVVTDRARADMLFDLPGAAGQAVGDGLVTAEGAAAWLADLGAAEADGTLLVAMTAFMAVGRAP